MSFHFSNIKDVHVKKYNCLIKPLKQTLQHKKNDAIWCIVAKVMPILLFTVSVCFCYNTPCLQSTVTISNLA